MWNGKAGWWWLSAKLLGSFLRRRVLEVTSGTRCTAASRLRKTVVWCSVFWCSLARVTMAVASRRRLCPHCRISATSCGECQTPPKRQTDRRQESNLVHFSRKMWPLVAIILVIFLIINQISCIFCLIPDFYSPLKFLWSIVLRSPYRMDAPDRHNWQTDKWTNGRVSLSVCLFVF